MIYGNFIEHLGRCIDGGIFEEKSPLSDANGFRKDVLEAVRKLNVTLLRWPGGNFSSNYHWSDGIGPRDQRPPRLEMAWGTVESNRFGTHEFLNYVETLGTEPYICANLGTGTWTEAQQWVEYCNSSEDTAMTRLRKQNGRRDPWKVNYWGLGNEMDGPWQMGHRSAEDYGKFALEAAKLMKWTDPNVKLIAAGSSNFGPGSDWTGWNRTVLEYLKHARRLSFAAHLRRQQQTTTTATSWPVRSNSTSASRPPKASSTPLSPGSPAIARSTLPGMNGTSGIAPAAIHSAAAAFSKSTTTWKTRWWSPPSSTRSSTTRTS